MFGNISYDLQAELLQKAQPGAYMLVVDTNILAYFYLNPEYLPVMQALLVRDKEWIAPSLWRSELRNVLLLYLRKGLLDFDRAIEVMAAAEGRVGKREYLPASDHVLSLARTSNCSAYDCEYLALAREIGTVLITYDRKLRIAFPDTAITPTAFLAASS